MTTCPLCRAELHTLADLVQLALQISGRAAGGLAALENRRLPVPSQVSVAVRGSRADGHILAEHLVKKSGMRLAVWQGDEHGTSHDSRPCIPH